MTSEMTCPTNWILGEELSFTIDRKSSSFVNTLSYYCIYNDNGIHAYSGNILTKSPATSAKFTPPLDWARNCPDSVRGTASFTLTTYDSSGTEIGSTTKNTWFTIPLNIKPSCSLSLSDTSSILVSGVRKSCFEYFGHYVSGVSTIRATISASGIYGSTIKSYSGTYPGGSFSTQSADIPTRGLSGDCDIDVYVNDSRNRKQSASVRASIVDYSPPTVTTLSVHRCASATDGTESDQGNFTQVTYGYAIYNIANSGKNAKNIVLKYKKSSESAWTTKNLTASAYTGNGSVIIETSPDNSYDFLFTVSDSISSSSKSTSVSTGYCIYHIPASGKGITFGGIAEGDGFNVKMPATFSGSISSSGNYNGKYVTGTWLQTTQATDLGKKPGKVAVIDESGWIYSRALSSLILEAVYPVGSIYMSVNSTSPETLFGGTWEAIQGKFLLGAYGDTYKAGSTGGEATHTLTNAEMPVHNHDGLYYSYIDTKNLVTLNGGTESYCVPWGSSSHPGDYGAGSGAKELITGTTGGGEAHNNMPPYLAVYIWKRTA